MKKAYIFLTAILHRGLRNCHFFPGRIYFFHILFGPLFLFSVWTFLSLFFPFSFVQALCSSLFQLFFKLFSILFRVFFNSFSSLYQFFFKSFSSLFQVLFKSFPILVQIFFNSFLFYRGHILDFFQIFS